VETRKPFWLRNWLERHQDPVSRRLHYVGIPLAILAVVIAGVQLAQWRWDLWWRPLALLLVGYVLQYLGHVREGNDMGEVILVKKLLGRPYCAVAPRYADRAGAGGERTSCAANPARAAPPER
jgi:uncharacterized membrane protein YGL010W